MALYCSKISILAVLADRDVHIQNLVPVLVISILAVLADRDTVAPAAASRAETFQSSRSLRTATWANWPLEVPFMYFNPRGPCGPRPGLRRTSISSAEFQSSRSLRTATRDVGAGVLQTNISILAVLADRDVS